ncbi:MAG TPA: dienelactone hydrolase family protein [Longimicrobiales bacterium]|nr:dienelactone hydrolase family protein [Longimicrobiales bacterium]
MSRDGEPDGYVELEVEDGTTMRAFVARPETPPRYAGILVLQAAFGVNAHIRDVAGRFAAAGFVAIAPELFHRTAPGFDGSYDDRETALAQVRSLTTEGLTADLRAAFEWLRGQDSVRGDRIAAVGFCMGGRAAFLANATLPLAASISYYGGGIAPALLDRAGALSGPQLLFWGGADAGIPPEQYRAVEDALRAEGKRHVSGRLLPGRPQLLQRRAGRLRSGGGGGVVGAGAGVPARLRGLAVRGSAALP